MDVEDFDLDELEEFCWMVEAGVAFCTTQEEYDKIERARAILDKERPGWQKLR